jgi:hypothetical protein
MWLKLKTAYVILIAFQKKYPIRQNYLEGQEVTSKMRGVLVDWLVEVHEQFHLIAETLYLTVAIIDRYLQVDTLLYVQKFQNVSGHLLIC